MRHRGPIVTLVAVFGLALVLLLVNLSTTDAEPPAPLAQDTSATPVPAPSPTPSQSAAAEPAAAPTEPAPSPFPEYAKYVGEATTAKKPIPVAITVDGGQAKAYVCDGKKIEAWLQGSAENGELRLTGRGENRLTGELTGDTVTGTVLIKGYPEWTFSATATDGKRAGVYRASGGGTTTGWIVRDEAGSDQVGISSDATGDPVPAPRLNVTTPEPASDALGTPVLVDGNTNVLADS